MGGAKLKQNGVALGVARGGGWAGLAWFACYRLVDYVLGWAVGFCFALRPLGRLASYWL